MLLYLIMCIGKLFYKQNQKLGKMLHPFKISKPIISTVQDKQNEWSLYRVSSTGSKVGIINIHFSLL